MLHHYALAALWKRTWRSYLILKLMFMLLTGLISAFTKKILVNILSSYVMLYYDVIELLCDLRSSLCPHEPTVEIDSFIGAMPTVISTMCNHC